MPENKHYKPAFTQEEMEECFSWFEQHLDELPPSLQLSPSLNIPDLRTTATNLVHKLRQQMGSRPVYSGQFAVLLMIREHIQEQLN